jgi:N-acetylmuramoyl-L-alanine amidase
MATTRRAGTLALIILAVAATPLGDALRPARAEPAAAAANKLEGPACDRAAFRVIVDVGHTAEAPGAKSARGLYEFDFNLALAKLIDQQLTSAGFDKTALLITEGKARKGLTERAERANRSSADLFLSIHHDSVPDRFLEKWEYEGEQRSFSDRFNGHSLFISDSNGDYGGSLTFGKLLGRQLKAQGLQYTHHYTEKFMGYRQRILVDPEAGVYRYDQLIVLRKTHMPAVLLEAGSIINRDEELAMGTPERQAQISTATLAAVDRFCALRRPVKPTQIARQPAAPAAPAAEPTYRPAAATTLPFFAPAKRPQ